MVIITPFFLGGYIGMQFKNLINSNLFMLRYWPGKKYCNYKVSLFIIIEKLIQVNKTINYKS